MRLRAMNRGFAAALLALAAGGCAIGPEKPIKVNTALRSQVRYAAETSA